MVYILEVCYGAIIEPSKRELSGEVELFSVLLENIHKHKHKHKQDLDRSPTSSVFYYIPTAPGQDSHTHVTSRISQSIYV